MLTHKFRLLLAVLMFCAGPVVAEEADTPPPQSGDQRDILQLDSSAVTGNQELPKVLYIVPWKHVGVVIWRAARSTACLTKCWRQLIARSFSARSATLTSCTPQTQRRRVINRY